MTIHPIVLIFLCVVILAAGYVMGRTRRSSHYLLRKHKRKDKSIKESR